MRLSLPILVLATFGATPALAQAFDDEDIVRQSVFYGDLDLRSVAGRSTLDRRIRLAARRVCPADALDPSDRRRCVRDAETDGRRQAANLP